MCELNISKKKYETYNNTLNYVRIKNSTLQSKTVPLFFFFYRSKVLLKKTKIPKENSERVHRPISEIIFLKMIPNTESTKLSSPKESKSARVQKYYLIQLNLLNYPQLLFQAQYNESTNQYFSLPCRKISTIFPTKSSNFTGRRGEKARCLRDDRRITESARLRHVERGSSCDAGLSLLLSS